MAPVPAPPEVDARHGMCSNDGDGAVAFATQGIPLLQRPVNELDA